MITLCFGALTCLYLTQLVDCLQHHKFGQKKLALCSVTWCCISRSNHGAECDMICCYNLYTVCVQSLVPQGSSLYQNNIQSEYSHCFLHLLPCESEYPKHLISLILHC